MKKKRIIATEKKYRAVPAQGYNRIMEYVKILKFGKRPDML